MSELLQEFVDSGNQQLRVDREAGVIRGVKLLGLASRNGRRYREDALGAAAALYEGAKVNINHPKGHPLSPRDYQDRLGVVRGVQFRAGHGLFGDLHFNPKHALSEQLIWDAEHAPQNVGMSHNVLARTSRSGEQTVVEAITKVQSIDLVADPATTSGLYEHAAKSPVAGQAGEEKLLSIGDLSSLTLEQFRDARPDLIAEFERAHELQLAQVREQLDQMLAEAGLAKRRERVFQLLQEHGLPLPCESSQRDSPIVSRPFMEALMQAVDDAAVRELIEERAALLRLAHEWNRQSSVPPRRPCSRDQTALEQRIGGPRHQSAQEFAAAIRGN